MANLFQQNVHPNVMNAWPQGRVTLDTDNISEVTATFSINQRDVRDIGPQKQSALIYRVDRCTLIMLQL